jgi:pimeloyl-ACP methyl ester carboxylesterase
VSGTSLREWIAGGTFQLVGDRGTARRIFVRECGESSGPAILFLHGFPTSSWDYAKVAPLLARFRCVFFDFLGFGASEKPSKHRYDLIEQADIAVAVGLASDASRFHIVAHDYGCSVAQELLFRHARGTLPFDVSGAVLLNGGLYPDLHRPLPAQRALLSPLGALFARAMTRRRFARAFVSVFSPERQPTERELDQHWASIRANRGDRIGHRLIRYIEDRNAHGARWIRALETTTVPLTFAWGMRDPVSGAHVMERLRERFVGRARFVVLTECGHYPQLEEPELVADAIDRYSSIPPSRETNA